MGDEPSVEELARFAETSLDPAELLQNKESRPLIFEMLSEAKAQELGQSLGIETARNWNDALAKANVSGRALTTVLDFFGAGEEEALVPSEPLGFSQTQAAYPLFDYQREVARRALMALREEPRKVMVHMPTGSGKTRTAMHVLAQHLSQQATLVCWLAPSAELLQQAADEFERAWQHLGNRPVQTLRFWGDTTANPLETEDGVVFAGLGKLWALRRKIPDSLVNLADKTSLVAVDEAHQATAPTYSSMIELLCGKRASSGLLGLTATPGRTWADIAKDEELAELFAQQKVTIEVEGYDDPVSFLVAEGYLAKANYRRLESTATEELASKAGDWATAPDFTADVLESLGKNAQRNSEIVEEARKLSDAHRRIIIFAPSVASARLLSATLTHLGYRSYAITSETRKNQRARAINDFLKNRPEPIFLCNYGVLTTGFDAPKTSAAIIARPTRSLVLYSQMVGRAIRGPRANGNQEAEIVTVVDTGLPGFGDTGEAFKNWEDVWRE